MLPNALGQVTSKSDGRNLVRVPIEKVNGGHSHYLLHSKLFCLFCIYHSLSCGTANVKQNRGSASRENLKSSGERIRREVSFTVATAHGKY